MSKQIESKSGNKKSGKSSSVRLATEYAKKLKALHAEFNARSDIRHIKADEIIGLALSLITSTQIKEAQERAVTAKSRKERLRQKFIAIRGPISTKEFDEFMTTAEYAEFLLQQANLPIVTQVPA